MPQLDPTWFASQLFWLTLSIAFLFVLLSRVVLPPLLAVLEARHETRAGDLALAQELKTEAEHAKQEYERVMTDARLRAQSIFTDAELQNKQASEAALAALTRDVHTQLAAAEKRIAQSQVELMRGLEQAVPALVSQSVEKLVGAKPDAARVKAIVQPLLRS